MRAIGDGVACLDLEYLGRPWWIATALLSGADGAALIDPGPASARAGLDAALAAAGLSLADVRAIVLTHIHLDHAGVTGSLVREQPGLRVFVHERGAPHVADPARLLASARRIYGDAMDRLWGEVAAVPASSIVALRGGERIRPAGRRLAVAYTPGHASHHVSYLDESAGLAFVGDTAGIRIDDAPFVLPVTPPPDIDLELWEESVARIRAWGADRLFVTHFGAASDAEWHLDFHAARLHAAAEWVRVSLAEDRSDADRASAFAAWMRADLERRLAPDTAAIYQAGGALEDDWRGLARYWRRRGAA